ncbi:MAG TPA: hypothetical protein VD905_06485 [Flavobacteriales bacterium]|nr:hypothetical protein [Flavobacteriales bacterium]
MKKLLTLLLASGLVYNVNAQAKEKEPTCLEAYQKAFLERGSFPVEDGTYKSVVVSIVTKTGTDCFSGKAKVEANFVTAIYIAYEDNTYEYLDKKYKGDTKAKINNGITEPLVTLDGSEKIYVIFTEKIKPKKKQFKKITGPDKNF